MSTKVKLIDPRTLSQFDEINRLIKGAKIEFVSKE